MPTCPASWGPKLPGGEEASFNVNRRGDGSVPVRAASAESGLWRAMCQALTGKEEAICPTNHGEGNEMQNLSGLRASMELSVPESNINPLP